MNKLFFVCVLVTPMKTVLGAPIPATKQLERSFQMLGKSRNFSDAMNNLESQDAASERRLVATAESSKKEMNERWFAVMALTKLKGASALRYLSRWWTHPQWFMRLASFKAVGYLHNENIQLPEEAMVRGLKDKSLLVRDGALEVLGKWCSASLQQPIVDMLDDPYHFRRKHPLFIRKRAVQVIGKCGFSSAKTKAKLLNLFSEKNLYGMHEAVHEALKNLTGIPHTYSKDAKKLSALWSQTLSVP